MKKITVLVPCYNEAEVLPLFVEAIKLIISDDTYQWEVLFVDDGSTDSTAELLQQFYESDNRLCSISLSRNFGKEAAMLAGLDTAAESDAVIMMDADLQHPVSVIPKMIERWEQGYDDVYARRMSRGKESRLRKFMTKQYYRLLEISTKQNVYPNVGDFRLLDRKCVEALRQMREAGRYTKGLCGYIGFKKTFVDFYQEERKAGKSKWSTSSLLHLALDGIMSYSVVPLRMATVLGLIVSIMSFVYMIYVLIKSLAFGDPVRGYPTLIIVILFLGGVELLSLGIIGEYLGKTFRESKHRPVYFIRDKRLS